MPKLPQTDSITKYIATIAIIKIFITNKNIVITMLNALFPKVLCAPHLIHFVISLNVMTINPIIQAIVKLSRTLLPVNKPNNRIAIPTNNKMFFIFIFFRFFARAHVVQIVI